MIIRLAEDDVLNGDIYGLIAPYATANFWVSSLKARIYPAQFNAH